MLFRSHDGSCVLRPLAARLAAREQLDDLGLLCLTAALADETGSHLALPVLKKAMTRGDVRGPLLHLPEEVRIEIVSGMPLFHTVDKSPDGALVAVPSPGWHYADLVPGAQGLERVIENILKWGTHRRTPGDPAPVALAVDVLVRFGPSAVARLKQAHQTCEGSRQAVFDEAMRRLITA